MNAEQTPPSPDDSTGLTKTSAEQVDTSRSPLTKLGVASARRWPVALIAWMIVLGLGVYAYVGGLRREGFPPVDVPVAVASGTYFVDEAAKVDRDVTEPIGAALTKLDSVKKVQSFALPNAFTLVVQFTPGFTSAEGATILTDIIASVKTPDEAMLAVQQIDATKFLNTYDLLVTVRGPADATAEQYEAEANKLRAVLANAQDVEQVDVRNLLTSGVNPETGAQQTLRTRYARVANPNTDGFTEAISIGIRRTADSTFDLIQFSDKIAETIESQTVLSDGYVAEISADFADDVRTQISSLTENLLQGLIAVAIVSLLLIGWRVSVVTALFMATVMLATLVVLWALGYSLNTITLFGLILTLGLLVDDAIVISEAIDANRDASDNPIDVVRVALNKVGAASLAGTLTTLLVFAPLAFVRGVLGEFIRAIPITVIATLIVSFVFSIVLISALSKPFFLRGKRPNNPVLRAEERIAGTLGKLAEYPARNGTKGAAVGIALVVGALAMVAGSFGIARSLGFNIFPPSADTNSLMLTTSFPPGTTIEDAQATATKADQVIIEVLGDDLASSQYLEANQRTITALVELTPFNERDTKSPVYIKRLEEGLNKVDGIRASVRPIENGPPVEEFPFAVQIAVDDASVDAGQQLATDIRQTLVGTTLDKVGGEQTTILNAIISTDGQVYRADGVRTIEVRANFSTDDLTSNLTATENLVKTTFPANSLTARGLAADAIGFDYGQESSNQEDFASLGTAMMIALGMMLLLLIIQFRSIVQPLLIFLAVPFSFFGVFTALSLSNNPLSFFVGVGFIALIGVVVNNTILLVDAANQARRQGMPPGAAIGDAVEKRFRPLVATTTTTVVGLIPLAISDPFWESLALTLIGGLLSSTLLVLIAFPVFYLAVERVRTPIRNAVRRRMGRPLI